ncbi:hypothetical protein ACJJTC_010389 [Scirpophaga incertulas]
MNSSSTASSSSDDEDITDFINYCTTPRRVRLYRTRINHFQNWDEGEFYNRFRLTKSAAYVVLEQIKDNIKWPTTRNRALLPYQMLLLTLKFMATGDFLICSGDFVGIHKSTAGKLIWRVLQAIVKLRSKYIYMQNILPTNENIADVKEKFYSISKFPNVIGTLDCTHVKLESPGGAQAETFRCTKKFFFVECTSHMLS